jgi:hypothetical protein
MRPKSPKWSNKNQRDMEKILNLADATGMTHNELAKVAGVDHVYFHRWTRSGKDGTRMSDEQVTAMLAAIKLPKGMDAKSVLKLGNGGMADRLAEQSIKELTALAGDVPKSEPDVMRYLSRKNAAAIFGQALRLMTTAKSEMVRGRMAEFLAERGFGKATQPYEDRKPPMEDVEFIDLLSRLAKGEDPNKIMEKEKPKKEKKDGG